MRVAASDSLRTESLSGLFRALHIERYGVMHDSQVMGGYMLMIPTLCELLPQGVGTSQVALTHCPKAAVAFGILVVKRPEPEQCVDCPRLRIVQPLASSSDGIGIGRWIKREDGRLSLRRIRAKLP